ncbi:hypothetical protein Zmor_016104 [Zophobas morio]|uniref:RING-type E3 ubiquitin transferase n=1 Tax=Zophobas morio TaxID=2755281 RepID=A0AA38IND0_9CUCU|nr:hypothetical protein Zmor_016104 [Zophobas morio]
MANENFQDFTQEMLKENVFSCRVCKNLLVAPVMAVENIGDVCHDCFQTTKEENKWNGVPNTGLVAILKKLKFPCKFQCETEVLYEDLREHENYCTYRPIDCLIAKEECGWVGKLVDLFKHFSENHTTCVLNEHCGEYSFEIDPQSLGTVIKLFTHKNRTYILIIEKLDENNSLLHFLKGESNMVVKYAARSKVIKTKLQALSFDVAFEERNGQKIQLSTLKEVMQEDDVIKVVIKPEKCEPKNVNSEITKHLECPVCKDIMREPIFQCLTGHSICQSCRNKLSKCPTCRKGFSQENIRNFSLEALIPFVQYECVYRQFGCTSMFLGSEIDEHEDGCTYQTYECPMNKCEFKGNFSSCRNHFKVDHEEYFVTATFYEETSDYFYYQERYFFEYGNIFKLTYDSRNGYSWCVRILSKYNKHDQYLFTVRVFNKDDAQCYTAKSKWCVDRNARDDNISFSKDSLKAYGNEMTFCYEIQKAGVLSNMKKCEGLSMRLLHM